MADKERDVSKGKFIVGVTIVTILLGLGMFIPADNFLWVEAWIVLILFYVFFINNIFYFSKHDPNLIKKRVKPKFTEKWDIIVTALTSIGFIPIFFFPGLDRRFGWSNVPLIVEIIGFTAYILGWIFIFLTMRENSFLSKAVEIQKGHKVINTGPYKIVRHPMYLGLIVFMTGWCLALGSLFSLIFVAFIVVGLIIRIVFEEKTLNKELEGYTEYTQKTFSM
ncbi:MAG: isoprenylcysteine carboxylmethyltransferase family protein [Candidatus Lokiarchaeota archaeon]